MKHREPMSIRSTLWLAIALAVTSSVLGTAGVQGYRMLHQSRVIEKLRVQTVAETYASQVAAVLETGGRSDVAMFVRRLAWHGDSQLFAVFGAGNEVLGLRGEPRVLAEYERVRKENPHADFWPVNISGQAGYGDCMVVAAPVVRKGDTKPTAKLVYAMSSPRWLDTGAELRYFVCIVLAAGTGLLLGVLWLNRQVLEPLALLNQVGSKEGGGADELPIHRDDEIGMLARTLSDMHLNLEQWRQRAVRLEKSIDDRVAYETQKITRELKRVERQIWTDALTRLGNRRLLDDKFAEIFKAQRDSGQDLSIVMIDVDYFKQLNDTLGHRAGDELLQFMGELLRQCLREQDLAIRFGGDEFILILPSVSPEQAQAIAERTNALFSQRTRLLDVPKKPSMSAGVASLASHRAQSAEELLRMADTALYEAKNAGKGRVGMFKLGMVLAEAR